MNKIKLLLTSIFAAAFMFVPAVAFAQTSSSSSTGATPNINGGLCAGANGTVDPNAASCNVDSQAATDNVQNLVTKVLNIFSWIVGVVSVIMIIFGGFKYITSGGDAGGVTGAKNTILYAIVGLVIVALAQVIVRFVIGTVAK